MAQVTCRGFLHTISLFRDASQKDPALHARMQALFQLNLTHVLARDNNQPNIATVPRHRRRLAGVLDCLTNGSCGGRTVLVGEGQDDVAVLAGEG
jgi:xanthine dehydrogenase iron-sulfur cluster and FAD-binding subunit A